MTAPESVVQAVLEVHDGERYDYRNDVDVPYCSACGEQWLDNRDCCQTVAVIADAAFAASLEWAAEQLAPAWPNPVVPPADRLRRWVRGDR
ncbi:hypothetical protein [Segeticoccus rhizosphaerae]|uniref:hypothetical protein n=1 Tax=Segeticoccus rhizosphaerae TaxID=1104777 RepID=UPI001264C2E9|nr:hypothetical protein [Segeticoccus rhizosphaerae]